LEKTPAVAVTPRQELRREPLGTRPTFDWSRYERSLYGFMGMVVFFGTWEYIGTSGLVNPLFTSAPSKIALAAVRMFCVPPDPLQSLIPSLCPAGIKPDLNAEIWKGLYVSGTEFVFGFGLAVLVAIPFGLLIGWYRRFDYVFEPFVAAFNATPRVALTPLLIIWFGIGIWSKVALVFLGGVFPIIINTQSGVRALEDVLLRAARSFGANDWKIFRTIALPGSVPFILSGIRVGLGRALVGIVVGELIGATAGIGYLISIAGATFQTDKLFVGIFIITGFGVLITNVVNRLEHRFDAWRPRRG
jgi:NitT/TauT family transport system permease protein